MTTTRVNVGPHFQWLTICAWLASCASVAQADPSCWFDFRSFSDALSTSDTAAIAKIVRTLPRDPQSESQQAECELAEVLKGDKGTRAGQQVVVPIDKHLPGDLVLIIRSNPLDPSWSTAVTVTPRACDYWRKVSQLPKDAGKRFNFYRQYLGDADQLISRDAFHEYADESYATFKALKPYLDHDQIVGLIQNPAIPDERRAMFLVMLSVCATEQDLHLFETIIKAKDEKGRRHLRGAIIGYLTLKEDQGLPLVEDLFLKNKLASDADTYAAISALRFLTTEANVVKRERILTALHYMLDRPDQADFVIDDLTDLEDWSVVDKLFELFKNSGEKNVWLRLPIIAYLRRCPLLRAQELLKECKRIDPDGFRKSEAFFRELKSAK